jgi:hypothetical protein
MLSTVKVRRSDIVLLIAAVLVTLFYVVIGGGGFPLDDSWIHQTYGRNLAYTGMWAFVPGVPSAASTSPLYTVVLAIGYWLRLPFPLWTHGIGALALGVTGIIGSRLAERAAPEIRHIGLAAGLALVLAWHLIWAAASGMETMLFCLFTLLLIWLVWQETDAPEHGTIRRGVIFGMCAALATLTRPEGVLLAGLAGLVLILVRLDWRWLLTWGAAAGTAFVLVLSPYLIYNVQITGGLLPNTAAAKQAWVSANGLYDVSFVWRCWNLVVPLAAGGQLLLVPGLVTFVIVAVRKLGSQRRAVWLLLPPLWGVALIGLYTATLPLPFQHSRYVIPALPALIVAGVIGTGWMLRWGRAALIARVLTRSAALAAALMFAVFAFGVGAQAYRQDVAIIDQEMVEPAHWIADNMPAESLLAVHDIGAVGYFTQRPLLDIAGLISPEFIPTIADSNAMWALLAARGARYLMAMPDQVPGADADDARLCPVYQSEGRAAVGAGGEKMTIYALAWDGVCS